MKPQAGDWPRAQALYEQQAALLRAAGMKAKLVYHLYTFSTLLYIRHVPCSYLSRLTRSRLTRLRPREASYYARLACLLTMAACVCLRNPPIPRCFRSCRHWRPDTECLVLALLEGASLTDMPTNDTYRRPCRCRGDALAAEAAARESLAVARQLFPSNDDEVFLRMLRCATPANV